MKILFLLQYDDFSDLSHNFFTTGVYYLQKSLYTVKLDVLYYNILKNENDMTFSHGLVGL